MQDRLAEVPISFSGFVLIDHQAHRIKHSSMTFVLSFLVSLDVDGLVLY